MENKPIEIGDRVIDINNNEGIVIAYSYRDSDWTYKHNYKIKYKKWYLRDRWLVYPNVLKIEIK